MTLQTELVDTRPSAKEAAYKIANELFIKDGVIPRADSIKKILGYGSNTSISEGLNQWFYEHHSRFMELNSRPGISDELFKYFNSFMDMAYREADRKFDVERRNYDKQINESNNKIELVAHEKQEWMRQHDLVQDNVIRLEESLNKANKVIDQLRSEKDINAQQHEEKEKKLQATIARLEKLISEKEIMLANDRETYENSLIREKARYDAMETRLIEQMNKAESNSHKADAERYKSEVRNEKLQEKLINLVNDHATHIQELNQVIANQVTQIALFEKGAINTSKKRKRFK